MRVVCTSGEGCVSGASKPEMDDGASGAGGDTAAPAQGNSSTALSLDLLQH